MITQVSARTSPSARAGLLVGACVLGFALALTGCGGSNGDSASGDSSSQPEPTATTDSGAAPSTPASSSSPAATADSAGAGTTFSGQLPDLDSYRYSFKLEGTAGLIAEISESSLPDGVDPETDILAFEVKGSYVKPDRGEATISFGGLSLTKIVIGAEAWQDVGDGFEGPVDLAAAGDEDYSFVATFWNSDAFVAILDEDFTCGDDTETVNGVATRKCSASRETTERLNQEGELFNFGILFERSTLPLRFSG